MSKIDVREAPIDAISRAIGEELRAYAKRQGDINALVENSGVSRSTLGRLFRGKPVSTDVLFRILRALERWDILDLLTEPPRLTPIEQWTKEQNSRKKRKASPTENTSQATRSEETKSQDVEPYSHVKMANRAAILANLKKDS